MRRLNWIYKQQRFEKAMAAELEKTSEVIQKDRYIL